MHWDVVAAQITGHLKFTVTFEDGLSGKVRMKPSHLYGVFERLKDPAVFKQLRIVNGFVSWPEEIDLAPDAMYEAISKDGEWILA